MSMLTPWLKFTGEMHWEIHSVEQKLCLGKQGLDLMGFPVRMHLHFVWQIWVLIPVIRERCPTNVRRTKRVFNRYTIISYVWIEVLSFECYSEDIIISLDFSSGIGEEFDCRNRRILMYEYSKFPLWFLLSPLSQSSFNAAVQSDECFRLQRYYFSYTGFSPGLHSDTRMEMFSSISFYFSLSLWKRVRRGLTSPGRWCCC